MQKRMRNAKPQDDRGQGIIEYGLIIGLVTIFCISVLSTMGTTTNAFIQQVAASLDTVGGSGGTP
jgi:Flp pilus assembly pilin Flp